MAENSTENANRDALDLLLRGYQVSCMLRVVAEVGVADALLPQRQATVRDLAAACHVLPEPLLRLIRALAAFQVFRLVPGEMVEHTPRSELLRSEARNSMQHGARFWTSRGAWSAWGELEVALKGEVPQQAAWNVDRFEYLRQNPDESILFDAMMANFPDDRHAAIADAYDFSTVGIIADIGGGNGATLRHILRGTETTQGILVDRTEVVGKLGHADLLDGRITACGSNFFDSVPSGAHIYMLVRVLHDWPDTDCSRILESCRAAMAPGAILLLAEHLLEPDPARGRPADYLTDMQMMAMFGSARQRSRQELQEMLRRCGFDVLRVIPTRSPVSILEARTNAG
jgi:hypothetical protein